MTYILFPRYIDNTMYQLSPLYETDSFHGLSLFMIKYKSKERLGQRTIKRTNQVISLSDKDRKSALSIDKYTLLTFQKYLQK